MTQIFILLQIALYEYATDAGFLSLLIDLGLGGAFFVGIPLILYVYHSELISEAESNITKVTLAGVGSIVLTGIAMSILVAMSAPYSPFLNIEMPTTTRTPFATTSMLTSSVAPLQFFGENGEKLYLWDTEAQARALGNCHTNFNTPPEQFTWKPHIIGTAELYVNGEDYGIITGEFILNLEKGKDYLLEFKNINGVKYYLVCAYPSTE